MPFNFLKLIGLQQLETYLIGRLLRSPTFHSMVYNIHHRVKHLQSGDFAEARKVAKRNAGPNQKGFLTYFKEELVNQAKGKPTDKF